MNQGRYVADTDFGFSSVRLRSEMALLVLFGCVCLASAAPQQPAAQSIVIVLSVINDKSQAIPHARLRPGYYPCWMTTGFHGCSAGLTCARARSLFDSPSCGAGGTVSNRHFQDGAPAHCLMLLPRIRAYRFIGFSVGVHSVFAALLGSLGDEAFSTRSYWLLTQCGALAIHTTHCRAEAMRSLVSALGPAADQIDPCWKYTPNHGAAMRVSALSSQEPRSNPQNLLPRVRCQA